MDEAQVFNILRQEQDEQSTGDSGGSDSQDNESGDGDPQDNESGSGSEQSAGAGLDQHDWDGAQELSDEEKRELARDIDEAIRQGAMAAGKMGGTGNRGLDELLQPQVDWREVLREFVQTTCAGSDYSTYARPNRRLMSQGIYMPSGISEQVEELVIAIDTSGSIGQSELTEFLSEVKGVCDTVKPNKVRLLYWGSDVVGDESYDMHELDNLVTSTKPMGGGGTDVNCVTQYMAKKGIKPQAVIVLTDGHLYGGWGEWTCPVLWTILDNERALADVGKTVHIKSRDM
jgi:predicted metal-dependent peptidase